MNNNLTKNLRSFLIITIATTVLVIGSVKYSQNNTNYYQYSGWYQHKLNYTMSLGRQTLSKGKEFGLDIFAKSRDTLSNGHYIGVNIFTKGKEFFGESITKGYYFLNQGNEFFSDILNKVHSISVNIITKGSEFFCNSLTQAHEISLNIFTRGKEFFRNTLYGCFLNVFVKGHDMISMYVKIPSVLRGELVTELCMIFYVVVSLSIMGYMYVSNLKTRRYSDMMEQSLDMMNKEIYVQNQMIEYQSKNISLCKKIIRLRDVEISELKSSNNISKDVITSVLIKIIEALPARGIQRTMKEISTQAEKLGIKINDYINSESIPKRKQPYRKAAPVTFNIADESEYEDNSKDADYKP